MVIYLYFFQTTRVSRIEHRNHKLIRSISRTASFSDDDFISPRNDCIDCSNNILSSSFEWNTNLDVCTNKNKIPQTYHMPDIEDKDSNLKTTTWHYNNSHDRHKFSSIAKRIKENDEKIYEGNMESFNREQNLREFNLIDEYLKKNINNSMIQQNDKQNQSKVEIYETEVRRQIQHTSRSLRLRRVSDSQVS